MNLSGKYEVAINEEFWIGISNYGSQSLDHWSNIA